MEKVTQTKNYSKLLELLYCKHNFSPLPPLKKFWQRRWYTLRYTLGYTLTRVVDRGGGDFLDYFLKTPTK